MPFDGMKRGGTVELQEHNPDWSEIYLNEAGLISRIAQPELLTLHHIGSTAIPGIVAKPIIDILGVWQAPLEAFEVLQDSFGQAGFVWRGEHGITGRRFLMRVDEQQDSTYSHVHVFQASHREIIRHLAFRDYLRSHPEVAGEYGRLKLSLLEHFRNDRDGYTSAKSDFINGVLELAVPHETG